MPDTHILIVGDSNALGFLNTGPAPYTPTAQVQIWARQPDGSYAWNYMQPGVNTGTPNNPADWGEEVARANAWLAAHAGDGTYLWIVKDDLTVKGGTTLAVDFAPGGVWFDNVTRAANAAMHNLDGMAYAFDHYDSLDLTLGENDAMVHAYAQAYGDNLAAFLPAARAAWHVEDVAMSRIEATMGAADDNLAVREAQWSVDQADADVVSFKTIGFEQQADQLHYDAAGQLALGHAFAEAWAV